MVTPDPALVGILKNNRMNGSVRALNGYAVSGRIGLRRSGATAAIASLMPR
jgi:hypothetical protein